MANVKVSELPAETSVSGQTVELVGNVGGTTSRIALAAIASAVVTEASAPGGVGGVPELTDEVLMVDGDATPRRLTLQKTFDAIATLAEVTPASSDAVPLTVSGVAKRATPVSLVTAARGERGEVLYRWTSGTGDVGATTRTARDTGGTAAGTLAVSAVSDRACPALMSGGLKFAATNLQGLVAREMSVGTLPGRFTVSFRYSNSGGGSGSYAGLVIGLAKLSGGVIQAALLFSICQKDGGSQYGTLRTVGLVSSNPQIDSSGGTSMVQIGAAPDDAAFDQGGYEVELDFARPTGTTPAQWAMRAKVAGPTGGSAAYYVGAGAMSGASNAVALLDGHSMDTLIIGAVNDSWSTATNDYTISDLLITKR